jgi:FkbH-like protein
MEPLPDNLSMMSPKGGPREANGTVSMKELLDLRGEGFGREMARRTAAASDFAEVLQLCTYRKRAIAAGWIPQTTPQKRVAMVGGSNLRPLVTFVQHFAAVLGGVHGEYWVGEYDNYVSEILDLGSPLYAFRPEVVIVLPAERRCVFKGALDCSIEGQRAAADGQAAELLDLCRTIHERTGGEVIVGNFRLSPYFDPGPMRTSSIVSDYAFRKCVNMRLGLDAPAYLHICDIEFLSNRRGNLSGIDDRTWFESKQPFAPGLLVDVAREFAHILSHIAVPAKKVMVLDLDNTLWGGVIGEDGIEGIELGTTSPRGEAFRDFQQYLLQLAGRGILLAVCSKNDHDKAIEPFEKHPEMVLKLKDIVSFKANWEPKSESIRQIAKELNLGLDSFVFIDDNPAEIEIVNQYLPEVATICAGDDPSFFVAKVKDSRYFEQRRLTEEDVARVQQYKQEAERAQLRESVTDMDAYLASLDMRGIVRPFNVLDVPRITQLIGKSNQFNLTTRRRSEAEVLSIIHNPAYSAFTVRLSDRFGDHGLISLVITRAEGIDLYVDTWLMSCRVLKRQVEDEVLNEIVRLAREKGCTRILGQYIPSVKNGMVADLYPRMGFTPLRDSENSSKVYQLDVTGHTGHPTRITVEREELATF